MRACTNGHRNPDGSIYCGDCGERLSGIQVTDDFESDRAPSGAFALSDPESLPSPLQSAAPVPSTRGSRHRLATRPWVLGGLAAAVVLVLGIAAAAVAGGGGDHGEEADPSIAGGSSTTAATAPTTTSVPGPPAHPAKRSGWTSVQEGGVLIGMNLGDGIDEICVLRFIQDRFTAAEVLAMGGGEVVNALVADLDGGILELLEACPGS